ncbi:DNA primase [Flavobacterium muglaense]|uniref:DNA primase n=1 Tax=Flavobacterium muglaense TaxID=2764716 RepID=A0A923N2N1_9FLAO|nr:DNA primase [Flavobacterium muglaense]MBC5839366.1 DNA primase [Flavobacterium muglaense]MBC5845882.1 DNA primase [Flavobacterium muglaense]
MKRVIVDYAKLTNEILNLLVERFPDGYDDSDIIRFRNAKNELIEAVEVRTEDTIYLVKVSMKLADRIENHDDEDDDEIDDVIEPIIPIKGLDLDDDDDDDDDKPDVDDEDDEDSDKKDYADDDDDDDDDED